MAINDSVYTNPESLRKLYRSPKNPLREAEQVEGPPLTGGPLEPVVNQPPINPFVPFTGDFDDGFRNRRDPTIDDLPITI